MILIILNTYGIALGVEPSQSTGWSSIMVRPCTAAYCAETWKKFKA